MPKQKKLQDLNHKISAENILKCLWAIRDKDQFYFISYGTEMINNLIKQQNGKVR